MISREEAAVARMAAIQAREGGNRGDHPAQRRSADDVSTRKYAPMEAGTVVERAKGDTSETHVVGMASVTERGYKMYDEFGEYTEVVSRDAFGITLGAAPAVEFALNHGKSGGAPMAATYNDTLTLSVAAGDDPGLAYDANVDTTRNDVSDMVKALKRGDLRGASFKFRIVRGQWSPDYTEFRIDEVDLEGGDVSSVNFGASPHAFSGVRSKSGQAIVTNDDLLPLRSL